MKRLRGRTAVITGAAGGIGLATAKALAARGANLALVDLEEGALAEAAEQIEGVEVTTHAVDVADRAAVEALHAAVLEAHGAAHLLITCAGVTHFGSFIDAEIDDLRWVIDVNLWGTIYPLKAFLPTLLAQDEAHVATLSSVFGFFGAPDQSAYCVSKFAVRALSASLWEELEGSGVGLTCVYPSGVRSGLVRGARFATPKARLKRDEAASLFDRSGPAPEPIGRAIVEAILEGRRRLVIGRGAGLFDRLLRLFPVWGNRLALKLLRRSGYALGGPSI